MERIIPFEIEEISCVGPTIYRDCKKEVEGKFRAIILWKCGKYGKVVWWK